MRWYYFLFGSENKRMKKNEEKNIDIKIYKNCIVCLFSKINFVFRKPGVNVN
jgi:hypothetical protein